MHPLCAPQVRNSFSFFFPFNILKKSETTPLIMEIQGPSEGPVIQVQLQVSCPGCLQNFTTTTIVEPELVTPSILDTITSPWFAASHFWAC